MKTAKKISESREEHRNHKQKRHDHGHGCDRKSLIIFAVFTCLTLSLGFHDIKICQTDDSCHPIKGKDHKTVYSAHAKLISENNRKNSKADNITKGNLSESQTISHHLYDSFWFWQFCRQTCRIIRKMQGRIPQTAVSRLLHRTSP